MDPLTVVAVLLALVAGYYAGHWVATNGARRARLDRLLNGYRDDIVDEERAKAKARMRALEDADLAWSSERVPRVVNLSDWRMRRRLPPGGAA